jgi:apolipoprotein N-acyltransferase
MILTNDGWLGNTTGPYQHYQVAILRAIENRVPVVRSANTGISGVILANGRTVHKESLGERAVFKSSISRGNTGSVYSRFGDVFSLVCFVIFVYLGPISCLRKKY